MGRKKGGKNLSKKLLEKRKTGKLTEKGKEEMESVKIGFDAVIHVNKSQIQGCIEGDEIHVPFFFDSGIKE